MGLMERIATLVGKGDFAGGQWGVHPEDHKKPAADVAVRRLPIPPFLYLPLAQHVGAAAEPIVTVGQRVLKGQCIAVAKGAISSPVHASTSGEIVAIGSIPAPHPSGLQQVGITLRSDMDDRWATLDGLDNPFAASPDEIGRRVAEAGVVGLGGATFPAAVKLNLGRRSNIHILIINGSECEPYLSCDDRLMRDHAEGVIRGALLMRHATGAREVRVGIEDNKPEAIEAMRRVAATVSDVKIWVVPARYPMGSDRQLILELTGIEVPADARAADVGVLVHNVGTAFAVHEAIDRGRPLVSRLLTISGAALNEPGNVVAPIGMLVDDVFAFGGGLRCEPSRLLMGGPMMGLQLPSRAVPVIKGTSGLLALSAAEVAERDSGPCIRCGSCMSACPVGLLPLEMNALIGVGNLEGAVRFGLKDCIACGCCAYVCPSRLPLVQAFNHAKGELAAQERSKLRNEATKKMVAARTERIERETREKAEAAAKRAAERKAQKEREAKEKAAAGEIAATAPEFAASAATAPEGAPA